MSKKFVAILVSVFAVGGMMAIVSPAIAGTINVDISDTNCTTTTGQSNPYSVVYCNIQNGIDDATASDTINVAAGTYKEHLTIDKSDLSLLGEDKETTIIDATQDSLWTYPKPGILLDGISGVTVSGFTIRDAELDETGNPWAKDFYGPGPQALVGILIYGSSDSVVEGNIFINNHWQVFLCAEAAGTGYERCDNNRIANNIIRDSAQDGVYLYSDGSVYVKNTEVVNNEISNAYGESASGVEFWGWPEGGATPTISNTVIEGNRITGCTFGVRIREDVGDATGTSVHLNNFADNSTQVLDAAEALDIEQVLENNTFDHAVTIDRPEESLLHTIWSSIQDTIDAALSGDTITVVAGTYNESVIINKNNLTILGDSDSKPAITGGLKFDTDLTGLTFKNFVVSGNAVVDKNSIVRMYGAIADLTIDSCVFDGENIADRNGFSGGQLEGDVTVTNSEFKNILGWALLDSRSGSGGDGSAMGTVTFANNNIHDSNGTVVFRGLSTDWTDNVYIYGNAFENIGETEVSKHWAAFEVNRANNVEIYNNQIRNVVRNLWGEGQAMQLWKVGTVSIYGNTIENNYQGIAILKWPTGETYDVLGISIYQNSFLGNNQYALSVDEGLTGGLVNAENNWWGDATGPKQAPTNPCATGDEVSDYVGYTPWLDAAYPDGSERTYNVENIDTPETFNSIQAAIDDAGTDAGDTINVAAGTYIQTDDLVIDKTVQIVGTSTSSKPTIQFDGKCDNISIEADNVILENLRFYKTNTEVGWQGSPSCGANVILDIPKGGPPNYLSLYGGLMIKNSVFEGARYAMYINSKGDFTVEDSEFINSGGDYSTIHIAAFDGTVDILRNTFGAGLERAIVVEPGPDEQILYGGTMNIIGNTVTGKRSFFIYNHWQDNSKKINLNLENNNITGSTNSAIAFFACGDISFDKFDKIRIKNNIISGSSENGIFADGTSCSSWGIPTTVSGSPNEFSVNYNNIYGSVGYGIKNDFSSANVNATQNWWGSENGPTHSSNTYNIDSQGDIVSDNVNFTPWLDALEGNSFSPVKIGEAGYPSIQEAIDAATTSDTINVAAGEYDENVVISKSLYLVGAGAETATINGNNVGNTVTITASDVTVSGFKITGGYANGGNIWDPYGGVVIDGNGGFSALTNIVIDNNIIDSNAGNGIYVSAAGDEGPEDNIKITNCIISNNGGSTSFFGGITLTYGKFSGTEDTCNGPGLEPYDEWRRPKNVLIEGNELSNDVSIGYVYGIYVNAGQHNTIRSNDIHGFSSKGLLIAASMPCTVIPAEYTTVENNQIYNNARNGIKLVSWNQYNTFTGNNIYNNGFGYTGSDNWWKYGFQFKDGNDNVIQNNIITGNALGGLYLWGFGDPSYTWYSTTNNVITGNTISNHTATSGHGIYIPVKSGHLNSGFLNSNINQNNITNNLYGLENVDTTQTIDATKNWWGDATGPKQATTNSCASGDGVSDNINYTPWLDAASPEGNERDHNVENITQGILYNCIQETIDTANPEDIITVAEGTYDEQVVIDKQLTLNGANVDVNAVTGARGSESIIDGGTSTAVTISADEVIVDGFTLDGGITLDDTANPISGGTISNNIITGADNDEEPIKPQNGIRVGWDYGLGVDGVTIEDNTIINSLAKGIRFANTKLGGGGPQHVSNITISGNEIKDNGSAGIETYGPGPNTIINNIISGNDGNGMNLKFGSGDVVTGNIITNNTGPGITLRQATDTTVEKNSVSDHQSTEVIKTCDTVIGGKGSGIHIFDTSEDNTIRFNDISGNNYGIFIHSKGDLQPSGNSINFNNIAGNINYGILNALVGPPTPVDATNNWWGTTVVSEVQAMVSDNVNYSPWYANQEMTSLAGTPVDNKLNLPTEVNINVTTSVGEVNVKMPAGLTVTGEEGWTGEINPPEVKLNSSVKVIPESGKTATVSAVIEIGYEDIKLTFDKAVRILIAGQAGKYAGYSRGGVFAQITTTCNADDQATVDAQLGPEPEGDCKIDVGSDLVIWTKHFTKFIAYTQTPIVAIGGGTFTPGIGTITPSISAISVVPGSNSATISWQTNKSSLTWIVYGTSTDYGEESKTTSYNTSHSVTLSDLSPETTYHYQIKSKDSSGNIGSYTDKTFTTLALGEKITGDINKDNKVDVSDFDLLMVNWGDNPVNSAADLDGNGKVDIFDFNLFMVNCG